MITIQDFTEQLSRRKPNRAFVYALEMIKLHDDELDEDYDLPDYAFKSPFNSKMLMKVSGNMELVKIKPKHFTEYSLVTGGQIPVVYKLKTIKD